MIKELGKPVWVVQKQPANHCLKSRGLAIGRGVTAARTTTGTIAAPTNQIPFLVRQPGVQALQRNRLCISTNFGDNRKVEIFSASGLTAVTKPLMQLPDGIT